MQRQGRLEDAESMRKIRNKSAIGQGAGYLAGLALGGMTGKRSLAASGLAGQAIGGLIGEIASSKQHAALNESNRRQGNKDKLARR
jgi:hypothetical protein